MKVIHGGSACGHPNRARAACRLLLVGVALLGGCSDRQLYEFGRDLGRSKAECETLTVAAERAACEAQFEKEYRDYQREREEL